MHPNRPDLLRPSLTPDARINSAPYSLQTGFLSAFFGGPMAAWGMSMLNAWRLGQLRRHAAWLTLMGLAGIGLIWFLTASAAGAQWLTVAARWLGPNAGHYTERLGALLLFAAGGFLHRREQRSADLFGLQRPNGWIAGVALIVGGYVASVLLAAAFGSFS